MPRIRKHITPLDIKKLKGMPIKWQSSKGEVFDAFIVIDEKQKKFSIKPLDPDDTQARAKGCWLIDAHDPKFCFWTAEPEFFEKNILTIINHIPKGTPLSSRIMALYAFFGASSGCVI